MLHRFRTSAVALAIIFSSLVAIGGTATQAQAFSPSCDGRVKAVVGSTVYCVLYYKQWVPVNQVINRTGRATSYFWDRYSGGHWMRQPKATLANGASVSSSSSVHIVEACNTQCPMPDVHLE